MFIQSSFYHRRGDTVNKKRKERSAIEKLKQLRKDRGLTQEELAKQVGLSREAIASLETRDIYPHADKLPAFADALGVSIDRLFGRDPMIPRNGG